MMNLKKLSQKRQQILQSVCFFCTDCWDQHICHGCLLYSQDQRTNTCTDCNKRFFDDCTAHNCVGIAWCQSNYCVCRKCVPEYDGVTSCTKCRKDVMTRDYVPKAGILIEDWDNIVCQDCLKQ